MKALDRSLGILLLLRGGRSVSATELASRFEVSVRTIYRDIETMSALGVPVQAEMGRTGGFKLREGYFLPPVTLAPEEAVSLLLGLILLRRLRVVPFPRETEYAEKKLLAALPEETRGLMTRAAHLIGFERVPADLLHHELDDRKELDPEARRAEGEIVSAFLRALISRARVRLRYRSPYRKVGEERELSPCGILWDRDRWYLVGRPEGGEPRLWRADRVAELGAGPAMKPVSEDFDVASLLDRRWLKRAMDSWLGDSCAKVLLTREQAERLKLDWYYGNAVFEELPEGRVRMVYGESIPEAAVELVRWLGPGAEIEEPREWRALLAAQLEALLAAHRG